MSVSPPKDGANGRAVLFLGLAWLASALCVFAQAPAETRAKADEAIPPQAGKIGGRVLSADGQPLGGVTVSLSRVGAERLVPAWAQTDAEGNFTAGDLPVGAYTVYCFVPGFVTPPEVAGEVTGARFYRLGDSVTITLAKGGVITGKVTDGYGQAVIGHTVSALRVRDAEGKLLPPENQNLFARQSYTDDRGIYRIYSLPAGFYLLSAGEIGLTPRGETATPTYYPAASRETAQEVAVRTGEEVGGIDIRHRDERGHAISGRVLGMAESGDNRFSITITSALTGARVGGYGRQQVDGKFALGGLPDGEYEVIATHGGSVSSDEILASVPRRVTIKGADVTGLELMLAPLAAMSGRVVLERRVDLKDACSGGRKGQLAEVVLSLNRDHLEARQVQPVWWAGNRAAPGEQGEFSFRNLAAGRYRLSASLPDERWYVRSFSGTANGRAADLAVPGINLAAGGKVAGLTLTVAEGAASLSGIIKSDSWRQPALLRVHLIPSEPAAAEDVLRYYETVSRSGAFNFVNLAPGRYWVVVKGLGATEASEVAPRPAAWDREMRSKLRREAEQANRVVELSTCQRVTNYALADR